ncbi:MAG: hypothetical protein ACMZ7B_11195 [Balneola sp.]
MLKTYRITLTLILGSLLVSPATFAQSNLEDVVYLKDGSVLRGSILSFNENISLQIQIKGGSQFFVLFEDVREIKKEPRYNEKRFKEKGYVNFTGFDRLPGGYDNSTRFQMSHGYQFNPHFSAGLGIAYVNYEDPISSIPLFVDLRYNLLKANSTPFAFTKLGYSFSYDHQSDDQPDITDHKGGVMLNVGVGLLFETRSGYGLYFNLGYNFEKMSYTQENFWWNQQTIENDITYKRVNFGLGLAF